MKKRLGVQVRSYLYQCPPVLSWLLPYPRWVALRNNTSNVVTIYHGFNESVHDGAHNEKWELTCQVDVGHDSLISSSCFILAETIFKLTAIVVFEGSLVSMTSRSTTPSHPSHGHHHHTTCNEPPPPLHRRHLLMWEGYLAYILVFWSWFI